MASDHAPPSDKDREIAKKSWQHGNGALSKQNFDLAIQMYYQAATKDPGNLLYRQSLRGAERKKYNDNGTGASMKGVKLMGVKGRIKKARGKSNWAELDGAAEEGLKIDPWDTEMNLAVADAAEAREHFEVAKFAIDAALARNKQDVKLLTRYANLLEELEEFEPALVLWGQIKKLTPDDPNIDRKMTQIHTSKMIAKTGADEGKGTKAMQQEATAYDEASGLAPSADGPGQDPESDLRRQIRKQPEDPNPRVRLADLLFKKGKLKEAAVTMKEAAELSGDLSIKERYEDMMLADLKAEVDASKQKARKLKDEKRLERAKKHEAQLTEKEIEILTRRAENHPKNMRVKYDLGTRLLARREVAQAIPLLQQATTDNRLESDARVSLGEAFLLDGKRPLAKRQFSNALEKIDVQDQSDLFCKCHYALGRLAEEAKEFREAERHYSEVLGVDYGYRDANERLTGLAGED
ncbi:tetratricopeptide repeat protein [Alienimonas californiensis]|uniref:Tetratricopeptide repeat protein n=1 Tax=Alienimonas californiensis TaxID=2527989 RepID=A0A517PC63_9PLAN|nr:tetratricopeptide repeat protein [Alienimonas californiensis]QDT16965.1 Tetratricopeptide repeat protein [Alienimonas californiensis]